jgi:hypothetical protein
MNGIFDYMWAMFGVNVDIPYMEHIWNDHHFLLVSWAFSSMKAWRFGTHSVAWQQHFVIWSWLEKLDRDMLGIGKFDRDKLMGVS